MCVFVLVSLSCKSELGSRPWRGVLCFLTEPGGVFGVCFFLIGIGTIR